MDQKIKIVFQF